MNKAPDKTESNQLKIRQVTMRRLRIVKPHTTQSMQDLASDSIDHGLERVVKLKKIVLPADCAFPVTK